MPRRVALPKDDEPPLDLSVIKCILNGSEPISAATVRRFNEAFAPHGFKPQAIKPSYGLAEATLFVSTTPMGEHPKIISVDREALNNGTFIEVPDDSPSAVAQAGAGKVGIAEWAVIVDAESATELPDGQIGEVWISGQNMGTGYWGKEDETAETFHNILKSRTNPSHAEGATDDATWVRTGDLGAYHDGELYITGRTKDLVIIDGRNHYPQDLEYSAQESTKALRVGYVAAFSVPANQLADEVFENTHSGIKRDPDDTSEQLVIVGERAPGAHKLEMGPIIDDIRAADRRTSRRHRARCAADCRGRHSTDLERQDRPPRLPLRVSGRQPSRREDRQRVPRRDRLRLSQPEHG